MSTRMLVVLAVASSCDWTGSGIPNGLTPKDFQPYRRVTEVLSAAEVEARADMALSRERRGHPVTLTTILGDTAVVVTSENETFVVTSDLRVETLSKHWEREQVSSEAHFGKMTPELFENYQQAKFAGDSDIDVQIHVRAMSILIAPQASRMT